MKKLVLTFMMVAGLLFAVPGSASAAWNPFDEACNKSSNSAAADGSAVCTDSNEQVSNDEDPLTGSNGLILKIATFVAFIAGAAAVVIIILAGLRMVTSSGGSEDVAGARRALIYACVGLVVIALARIIVGFIISAL